MTTTGYNQLNTVTAALNAQQYMAAAANNAALLQLKYADFKTLLTPFNGFKICLKRIYFNNVL